VKEDKDGQADSSYTTRATITPNVSAMAIKQSYQMGVYLLHMKALKLRLTRMNKRYEDGSSSNFDGDPVVDNLKLG
jgi:hypothetical protein